MAIIPSAPAWRRRGPRAPVTPVRRGGGSCSVNKLHKRPRYASPQRRKSEGTAVGGYNQWSRRKVVTGRRVKPAVMDRRLVRANREYSIQGHRNLKNFDDYGAVPINSSGTGDFKRTPVHCYSLNSQIIDGDITPCARYLGFNDLSNGWYWQEFPGMDKDGALVSIPLQMRKSSPCVSNQQRQYHEYTTIKMNLWGAKAKAIRYQIDLIQPLSDEVNPYHWAAGTVMGTAAGQAWEEMVKQYTFNPIAKMDHYLKRNFRTIKSISFIIEPTSTTESDADPHVKTLEWFIRRNKLVNFDKATTTPVAVQLQDGNQLKTAAEYTANLATSISKHPRDREQLLLLVRASDYGAPADFSNVVHGSYDIDFATKYTCLG